MVSCGRAGHGGQELPGHPEPGWGAAGATSPGGNPRTCQVGVSWGGKCQGRICTHRICCPQKAGSDILGGDAHVMVFLPWTYRFLVKESEVSWEGRSPCLKIGNSATETLPSAVATNLGIALTAGRVLSSLSLYPYT